LHNRHTIVKSDLFVNSCFGLLLLRLFLLERGPGYELEIICVLLVTFLWLLLLIYLSLPFVLIGCCNLFLFKSELLRWSFTIICVLKAGALFVILEVGLVDAIESQSPVFDKVGESHLQIE
jgi:hypothetical protein